LRSEHLTLLSVQIGIIRIDLPLGGSGLTTPSDAKLDIVVLETNEGKRRLPVFTESKPERVERNGAGTIIETGGDRL
jgi:hypothetical protein